MEPTKNYHLNQIYYPVNFRWCLNAGIKGLFFASLIPIAISFYYLYKYDQISEGSQTALYIFLVGMLLFILVTLVIAFFRRGRLNFKITEQGIEFQNKILTNRAESVIFKEISKLEIKQNTMDKIFDVASLWIWRSQDSNTPFSKSIPIVLPCDSYLDAESLKQFLEKIKHQN